LLFIFLLFRYFYKNIIIIMNVLHKFLNFKRISYLVFLSLFILCLGINALCEVFISFRLITYGLFVLVFFLGIGLFINQYSTLVFNLLH